MLRPSNYVISQDGIDYQNLKKEKNYLKYSCFKGSVQRDEWGVGHMYVQFLLVWDSRDRDWLEFLWRRRLLTSIFLFPPTPVKRIGQIEII